MLWGVVIALALSFGVPAVVHAQLSRTDARCRSGLGKGVGKLAKTIVLAQARCHQQRSSGALPQSVDCNDPTQSPSLFKIQSAADKLKALAEHRCAAASAPSALGYLSCPAPCEGPTADYASLADCFTCLTERWLGEALTDGYGTQSPVPLGGAALSCQAAVGDALRTDLVARMREQRRCQYIDDRDPIAPDCLTADLTGRVAQGLAKARRDLDDDCTDTTVTTLDTCADTVDAEKDCVEQLATSNANLLFFAVYRPGVLLATPTPTSTPSSTGTETVTETPTAADTATSTATAPPASTATATSTPNATFTATRTPALTATATPVATATTTATATFDDTATATATATQTPIPTATFTALPPIHIDVTPFPGQAIPPCLIFVHGKRTNTDTYTDWNAARDYWKNGSDDFIRAATKNFTASYYVVGYNGTQPYWHEQAAGELANEIVNATNGGTDGGGNRCTRTFAEGGTFWLVGHSMAGSLIDYVLGNADPSDPNYNLNGPYDVAAQRVSLAISVAGTHRGSQGADFVCGDGNPFCNFFAQFIQSCDAATYWLRSADDVQVRLYASAPARTVWLAGGYAAIIGASSCLSGEDDGVVQHASAYACDGSATTAYTNSNLCGNANKQESSGFKNLDTAHENHDQERNDSHTDVRVAIPTGVWICNGAPCAPNTTVHNGLSTAAFVGTLY